VPTREELKKDTHDTYDTTVSLTPQAFNSFLKIPASGYRNSKNGDYQHFVHTVHMWTRSANANNLNAYYLYLNKKRKKCVLLLCARLDIFNATNSHAQTTGKLSDAADVGSCVIFVEI
jgi:hypothetical protein